MRAQALVLVCCAWLAVFACGGSDEEKAAGSGGSGNAQNGGSGGGGADASTTGGAGGTLPDVSCPTDPVDGFEGEGTPPEAVPTFHSVGIYWKPPGAAADNQADVQVRRRGECDWRGAQPLWFDPNAHEDNAERQNEYRGSLLDLVPGTKYEVRLTLAAGGAFSFPVETLSETFPIAKTITLDGSTDAPLVIDEGGSETGYVLYTAGANGHTIDVAKAAPAAVQVNASYVIVRGLTLRGGAQHGIRLGAVNHVVIEDCEISDWGSLVTSGDPHYVGFGDNFESGVYSNAEELSHVVVQRNDIHHPTYDTNSWDEFDPTEGTDSFVHPQGPQGISFIGSAGHHIIRYNHIHSDDDHKFNDGMGDHHNFSYTGFPGRDSDIYGNLVTHVWDDAIEAEGNGMNVRVFGNYVDRTFIAFGMATQSLGPFYLYRNVSGFSQRGTVESGTHTRGGSLVKIGSEPGDLEYSRGRIEILHNTIHQPPSPFDSDPGGAESGVNYSSSTKVQENIRTRNNLLHLRDSGNCAVNDPNENASNDFDSDLTNGEVCAAATQEPNLVSGSPTYASTNQAEEFFLASSSPGFDQASALPGVNGTFSGAGPDMGAFEAGAPALRFGLDADWTTWSAWVWSTP
jgi:hypothetical protein